MYPALGSSVGIRPIFDIVAGVVPCVWLLYNGANPHRMRKLSVWPRFRLFPLLLGLQGIPFRLWSYYCAALQRDWLTGLSATLCIERYRKRFRDPKKRWGFRQGRRSVHFRNCVSNPMACVQKQDLEESENMKACCYVKSSQVSAAALIAFFHVGIALPEDGGLTASCSQESALQPTITQAAHAFLVQGVILYEMAMLSRPYEADSMQELMKKIVYGQYTQPDADCPVRISRLIFYMLSVCVHCVLWELCVRTDMPPFHDATMRFSEWCVYTKFSAETDSTVLSQQASIRATAHSPAPPEMCCRRRTPFDLQ